MPEYTFENVKTGEVKTIILSMSEREEFLQENPEYQQIFTQMNIGDHVRLGVTKPKQDFQELMGRIKKANPYGKL